MHTVVHLKTVKYIEYNPEISQPQLAQELAESLGKLNYYLKTLINKGSMKVSNFRRNTFKFSYL